MGFSRNVRKLKFIVTEMFQFAKCLNRTMFNIQMFLIYFFDRIYRGFQIFLINKRIDAYFVFFYFWCKILIIILSYLGLLLDFSIRMFSVWSSRLLKMTRPDRALPGWFSTSWKKIAPREIWRRRLEIQWDHWLLVLHRYIVRNFTG